MSAFLAVILFIAFIGWIVLFLMEIGDVIKRKDLPVLLKVVWIVAFLALPLIGVVAYLVIYRHDIASRRETGYA
jgi:phospholipase D-like protein